MHTKDLAGALLGRRVERASEEQPGHDRCLRHRWEYRAAERSTESSPRARAELSQ